MNVLLDKYFIDFITCFIRIRKRALSFALSYPVSIFPSLCERASEEYKDKEAWWKRKRQCGRGSKIERETVGERERQNERQCGKETGWEVEKETGVGERERLKQRKGCE